MAYTYKHPRPSVTTDALVFTIREHKLHVLLIRRGVEPFKGHWALPGGFLKMDEELETCVARELSEETGVSLQDIAGIPLTQFRTYGTVGRDPRGRTISVAFLALVPSESLMAQGSSDADEARWFAWDDLPPLAFDHAKILTDGRAHLARLVNPQIPSLAAVAFEFLPEVFTLSDAQGVFEVLRGEDLDKRNFRKWFAATWKLQETGEMSSGLGRPAALYKWQRDGAAA